ncbi:MAG TPA: hypothetical protein VGG75_25315 [Trebonia sp.]
MNVADALAQAGAADLSLDGWQIFVHPDGTVTARAPWGTVLHTNDTVAA